MHNHSELRYHYVVCIGYTSGELLLWRHNVCQHDGCRCAGLCNSGTTLIVLITNQFWFRQWFYLGGWRIRLPVDFKTLYVLNSSSGAKHITTFHIIPPHWYDTGSWNPSSSKTRTYLFYIVNIMVADVLATKGVRTSTTMILTYS